MSRSALAVAALAVLALASAPALAGTNADLTVTASEATVTNETLNATGYELDEREPYTTDRTFSIAGQDRTVQVNNQLTTYEKPGDGEVPDGRFAAVTSPQIHILGQSFNPVGEESHRELLDRVDRATTGFEDVEKMNESNATVLGENATVSTFAATTEQNGTEVDVYVHVTRVTHEGDYVILVGAHPQDVDERENVTEMMEGVEQ